MRSRIRWQGRIRTPAQTRAQPERFHSAPACHADGTSGRGVDVDETEPSLQFGEPPRKAIQYFTCLGKGDCAQSGDGTVPRVSGSAPGRAGVKHLYRLELWKDVDAKNPAKSTAHDHQDAFNNEQARAVTLYALAKILQEAP